MHRLAGKAFLCKKSRRPAFDSNFSDGFLFAIIVVPMYPQFPWLATSSIFYQRPLPRHLSWFWNKCWPVKCDQRGHAALGILWDLHCLFGMSSITNVSLKCWWILCCDAVSFSFFLFWLCATNASWQKPQVTSQSISLQQHQVSAGDGKGANISSCSLSLS